ncbi:hypothetical protein SAMN04488000_13157 [Lentzea albida]|uniref:Uncharacterized protein n=1 Tax=Lentzea albida TaxID=65499 RepID=A0A1H9XBA7_9PSEU|nr:hypothetical protein SAMN04488000_13157 [Lentzea albida]
MLLGEPGVGKSSAFRALTATLPRLEDVSSEEAEHSVLWVDGADLIDVSFDAFVGRALAELRVDGSAHQLTLVLDQLDESPMRERLPGRLDLALRGVEPCRVKILVACRTADFQDSMREVLERRFERCVLADLAPLSRADAVSLAGTRVDGEALVDAAVSAGAGILASVPLTLELIVRQFERDGHLAGGTISLFRQGVWQLAEEPDPERPSDVCSVEQRLAIAGRIAARLLLSGRRSIWRGNGLEARPSDLVDGTLAGGAEHTRSVVPDGRAQGVFFRRGNVLEGGQVAQQDAQRQAGLHGVAHVDRDRQRPCGGLDRATEVVRIVGEGEDSLRR